MCTAMCTGMRTEAYVSIGHSCADVSMSTPIDTWQGMSMETFTDTATGAPIARRMVGKMLGKWACRGVGAAAGTVSFGCRSILA